jgi:hypothetical protein
MPIQTKLQMKLFKFQGLNPNQINHQNPIDFQILINSTLLNNMASQLVVNQPNPPPHQ